MIYVAMVALLAVTLPVAVVAASPLFRVLTRACDSCAESAKARGTEPS